MNTVETIAMQISFYIVPIIQSNLMWRMQDILSAGISNSVQTGRTPVTVSSSYKQHTDWSDNYQSDF